MVTEHSKLNHLSETQKHWRLQQRGALEARFKRGTITRESLEQGKAAIDAGLGVQKAETHEFTIGQLFGKLSVTELTKNKHGQQVLACTCDCGGSATTTRREILTGGARSCGCLRAETAYPIGSGELALNKLLSCYKGRAKKGGIEFDLPREVFKRLVLSNCHYCGDNPSREWVHTLPSGRQDRLVCNGVDRVVNGKGYTLDNAVPACARCNYAKGAMELSEFVAWALRFVGGGFPTSSTIFTEASAGLVFTQYRLCALRKNLPFELTRAQLIELVKLPCIYCGAKPYRVAHHGKHAFTCNGVDRQDNNLGYTRTNSVSCCLHCNYGKRDMPVEEFRAWVARLAAHLKGNLNSNHSLLLISN